MNINSFNLEDLNNVGAECTIHHPLTFENTDIKIILFGQNSKEFKRGKREAQKYSVKNKYDDSFVHCLAASMIKSWENVENDEGAIEFNIDNAIQLFKDCPFIYAQVEAFIEDQSNFFLQK